MSRLRVTARRRTGLLACLALAGCASQPPSIITTPMTAAMPPVAIERPVNGAIFQASANSASLFSSDRSKGLGDLVKVQISEKLVAASKSSTDSSRETSFTAKGPGAQGTGGVLGKLLDMDADSSGTNKFKGGGTSGAESSFDGQLVATIVNVMPNGNLLLAGERVVAFGGSQTGLRFAGVVDPKDVKYGNVVSSSDVGNARIEVIAAGEVSEASNRRWIQKVLSNAFTIW